jgi:hypothetical protein
MNLKRTSALVRISALKLDITVPPTSANGGRQARPRDFDARVDRCHDVIPTLASSDVGLSSSSLFRNRNDFSSDIGPNTS